MTESNIVANTIAIYDGALIDPFAVRAEDGVFRIETIAHALAHTARYGGHARRFYSVAEHCLLVERIVRTAPKYQGAPLECQWALLHDADEAYLLDMPAPIKRHPEMAFYRAAGKRLMGEIAKWLRLSGEEPAIVSEVDVAIRGTEMHWLFPRIDAWGPLPEPYHGIVCGTMSPEGAKAAFLARFYELFSEHKEAL